MGFDGTRRFDERLRPRKDTDQFGADCHSQALRAPSPIAISDRDKAESTATSAVEGDAKARAPVLSASDPTTRPPAFDRSHGRKVRDHTANLTAGPSRACFKLLHKMCFAH
jgi:hypothetical protein